MAKKFKLGLIAVLVVIAAESAKADEVDELLDYLIAERGEMRSALAEEELLPYMNAGTDDANLPKTVARKATDQKRQFHQVIKPGSVTAGRPSSKGTIRTEKP